MKKAKLVAMVIVLTALIICSYAQDENKGKEEKIVIKKPGLITFSPDDIKPKVEIQLDKPILNLIRAASRNEEPEFSKLLEKLEMVKLQVIEAKNNLKELEPVKEKIDKVLLELKTKEGWSSIINVNEENEKVDILMKVTEERIRGLGLFVRGDKEVVFINIVGDMDAEEIGSQLSSVLGKVMSGKFDMSKIQQFIPTNVKEEMKKESEKSSSHTMSVGEDFEWREVTVKLTGVYANDTDNNNDDSSEIKVRYVGRTSDITLEEFDSEIVGGYTIIADEITPSSTPGEGNVRLTIKYK